MPIPDYQTLMLPLLQFTADGKEHPVAEIRGHLSATFGLTAEELAEKLNSGSTLFANRVAWALSYLSKAQLLSLVTRGVYQIRERGVPFLNTRPTGITAQNLRQFPEFANFYSKGGTEKRPEVPVVTYDSDLRTPEEQIETGHKVLQGALAADLLQVLLNGTPVAFEKVVVNLLVAMGYGGSQEDAGKVVGKSGDGGIDGVIKQDRLGLDAVYVQAKRWKDVVGSPEIMKFSGSLTKRHAIKGVFITTSYFSKDALEYVEAIPQKIVLIDGITLASLMIEHEVGVTPMKSYVIKRLDQDYFETL